MIIISGSNTNKHRADKNHKKYADFFGLEYRFYLNKKNLFNPYHIKLESILECFEQGYEQVFWIDDDAFFVNFDWDARDVFKQSKKDLIVTASRPKKEICVSPFNSGVMFLKNTENVKNLILDCLNTNKKDLRPCWHEERFGRYKGNDQLKLNYYVFTKYSEIIEIRDYPGFNTLPSEFLKGATHPIVHFPGKHKEERIKNFIEKTGIDLP